MISDSPIFDQSTLVCLLAPDPVMHRYRQLFVLLDWSAVQERDASSRVPGPFPQSRTWARRSPLR